MNKFAPMAAMAAAPRASSGMPAARNRSRQQGKIKITDAPVDRTQWTAGLALSLSREQTKPAAAAAAVATPQHTHSKAVRAMHRAATATTPHLAAARKLRRPLARESSAAISPAAAWLALPLLTIM